MNVNDEELNRLIRESSPPPEFPVSFQREVWQSIAMAEGKDRSLMAWLYRSVADMMQWIARPAAAVALILTMLLVGAGLGEWSSTRAAETNLKAAYAASINPITAAHAAQEK